MKSLVFTILILFSSIANSYEFVSGWSPFFEKELKMVCSEGDYSCDQLCQNDSECLFEEKVCRNCIGSSIYLTHIFDNVGKSIVRREEKASFYELFDLINFKLFSSISSKSIYNHVTGYNSKELKEKFQSLCLPYKVEYPVIIFEMDTISGYLGKPKYLICNDPEGTQIFRMGDSLTGVETGFSN